MLHDVFLRMLRRLKKERNMFGQNLNHTVRKPTMLPLRRAKTRLVEVVAVLMEKAENIAYQVSAK